MLYRVPAAESPARALRLQRSIYCALAAALILLCSTLAARAQAFEREVEAPGAIELRVRNRTGRVTVEASEDAKKVSIRATSAAGLHIGEKDVRVSQGTGSITIEVERASARPTDGRKVVLSDAQIERERIDLLVSVPARSRVFVETEAGAVDLLGNISEGQAKTDTGTIRADVPLDALRYSFRWTLSRPRFFSEVELPKVKSKLGGAAEIAGRFGDKHGDKERSVRLDLETARGVVLFGVKDEAEVPSDLRERALTEAARAIIRSGDTELIGAIRKVAPRLVADYVGALPKHGAEPAFASRANPFDVRASAGASLARVQARVTDHNGRAIAGLTAKDFTVTEDGSERAVRDVQPATAPFNLILVLDVSGSVEERIDFIRKAALSFLDTASPQDRIAIISFRDDVQLVSDFTTDRHLLSERIKDIQAGGATALYDALGYSLVDTLKPLRGERTGIVVLSDGDDNRSFLSFQSVVDTIYETGAIIYPLYIPSGLMPASDTAGAEAALDPTRSRFLELTSRADVEGRKLAEVSGGTYYPVTRLEQLQKAYDDVAAQLRTAYTITYESSADAHANSRVRVRVAREGASVRLSPAVGVAASNPASPKP
ncbi:MAG TPA: VWA domain-containing protein [Pyrinomonadaceae bacterium]|nr:VWA domain-containing protein [Pyrinomonadaceae bacterium]